MLDEDMRSACFLSLDVLCAKHGPELPYKGVLEHGFSFRGSKVPYLSYMKGIYRSARQSGPAALSVNTSSKSPYGDEQTPEGIRYAYRAGAIDQADNRALRSAHLLQTPIVYFDGTRPGYYTPEWPVYVTGDDPISRFVMLSRGKMIGPYDEREAVLPDDEIERQYQTREMTVRMHQGRFRGRVLPAYLNQCAICRLKETRLLDAAHIVADKDPEGLPAVSNGLSLCTIHHRAYDQDLVGISPDYEVRLAPQLLEEEDGPMLDLLKKAHATLLQVPKRILLQPDRELLAIRFDAFTNPA